MHAEKVSEIIAHFIGLFDSLTEEMRMRQKYLDGAPPPGNDPEIEGAEAEPEGFASDLQLKDYLPGVDYRSGPHDFDRFIAQRYDDTFNDSLEKLTALANEGTPHLPTPRGMDFWYAPQPAQQVGYWGPETPATVESLTVHSWGGASVSHVLQANVLRDDDYLNMTDGPSQARDTGFVLERLAEFATKAEVFAPFNSFKRTDSPEELVKFADQIRAYAQRVEQQEDAQEDGGKVSLSPGAEVDFVLAAETIEGIYVNGELADEVPLMSDFVPDRGLAEREEEEPDDSQTSVHEEGPGPQTLAIEAGANFVVNIASVVDAGLAAPVTAVMGDYRQIDVISQVYIYSDSDTIEESLKEGEAAPNSAVTIGMNVAIFQHNQYEAATDTGAGADGASSTSEEDPIFPSAWRVSVVDGDVSFINWTEQYNFITDSDTITATTSGAEIAVLTGGNDAINLATYFGFGIQYDLIIVGGNVLDMNVITQISVLYDNDRVGSDDDATVPMTVQSGGNLLWNVASIENVGGDGSFQPMPDYMIETINGINARDPQMPAALAHDANFEGYMGLNILYITGDLYGVNMIKQVSIVGDADDVLQVANTIIEELPDAVVTVDTGSNVVGNVAQIIDYDSFGTTTYVGGQVYSDAILIQGGLVEHDASEAEQPGDRLANEVIAFLADTDMPEGAGDSIVDTGHDLSWSDGHAADVMQTVVA